LEEARATVMEAIALAERTGESYCSAELQRVKAEITRAGHSKTPFAEALCIAQQQQAKSWELRVLTSLERFHRQKDGHREARKALSEAYAWFTEGYDTTDLKNARSELPS
jgi:predicted ATPase